MCPACLAAMLVAGATSGGSMVPRVGKLTYNGHRVLLERFARSPALGRNGDLNEAAAAADACACS
jgi:hypothetical protein